MQWLPAGLHLAPLGARRTASIPDRRFKGRAAERHARAVKRSGAPGRVADVQRKDAGRGFFKVCRVRHWGVVGHAAVCAQVAVQIQSTA